MDDVIALVYRSCLFVGSRTKAIVVFQTIKSTTTVLIE